jgi:hypothetical protein
MATAIVRASSDRFAASGRGETACQAERSASANFAAEA